MIQFAPSRLPWFALFGLAREEPTQPFAYLLQVLFIQIGILFLVGLGAQSAGQWMKAGSCITTAAFGFTMIGGRTARALSVRRNSQ